MELYSKEKQLTITQPIVMGILNATPNSFYNKGRGNDVDSLLHTADIMLQDGATILDVGGASSKPGEPIIAPEEELRRVIPIIAALSNRFPQLWISVDTYNATVAKAAVEAGAAIVNDISAGAIDPLMLPNVAALKVPYIAMHMQGTPATMQLQPQYTHVVAEVKHHLRQVCDRCALAGIEQVILDPGFGFGKTVEHNYELLTNLEVLATLGKPILAGLSRKSMVCKPLRISPENALNGTTALNMVALMNGVTILRVHDVKEAIQAVTLFSYMH
jgi:dihydropteroate synthase